MVAPFKRVQTPRPLYRHRVFATTPKVPEATQDIAQHAQQRDRFGLGPAYFTYPDKSREYAARALDFLGLPKGVHPRPFATIAELVVFGMLLSAGFHHYVGPEPGGGTFVFQSYELGGRQPGGAVVDFVLFHRGAEIGIRVQSIFHSPASPFGNGAGDLREMEQSNRLLGAGFERIVSVNEPQRGFPIENGPNELVRRELDRILGRYAA